MIRQILATQTLNATSQNEVVAGGENIQASQEQDAHKRYLLRQLHLQLVDCWQWHTQYYHINQHGTNAIAKKECGHINAYTSGCWISIG